MSKTQWLLLAVVASFHAVEAAQADNSCQWSNDGACDDGSHCPTGTDCADCSNCPADQATDDDDDDHARTPMGRFYFDTAVGLSITAFVIATCCIAACAHCQGMLEKNLNLFKLVVVDNTDTLLNLWVWFFTIGAMAENGLDVFAGISGVVNVIAWIMCAFSVYMKSPGCTMYANGVALFGDILGCLVLITIEFSMYADEFPAWLKIMDTIATVIGLVVDAVTTKGAYTQTQSESESCADVKV